MLVTILKIFFELGSFIQILSFASPFFGSVFLMTVTSDYSTPQSE